MIMCPHANDPEVRAKAEAVHQGFIKRAKDRSDDRGRPSAGPSMQGSRYGSLQDLKNRCWGCDASDHAYFDKEKNMVTCPRANDPEVRARAAAVHQEFKKRRSIDRYSNDNANSTRQHTFEGGGSNNEIRREDDIQPSNPRFRHEY